MTNLVKEVVIDTKSTYGRFFWAGQGTQKFNYENIAGVNTKTTARANTFNVVSLKGAVLTIEVPLEVDLEIFKDEDEVIVTELKQKSATQTVKKGTFENDVVVYTYSCKNVTLANAQKAGSTTGDSKK